MNWAHLAVEAMETDSHEACGDADSFMLRGVRLGLVGYEFECTRRKCGSIRLQIKSGLDDM